MFVVNGTSEEVPNQAPYGRDTVWYFPQCLTSQMPTGIWQSPSVNSGFSIY